VNSQKKKSTFKMQKPHLVQDVAEKLRDIILAREPGAQIGSLNDVAQLLDVGIVTVQQAARVLEHEGLLAVRRGPGGGYYGARPDDAALERSVAAYMRVHNFDYLDALEMTVLIDCDIMPAAARCTDTRFHEAINVLLSDIDKCSTSESRAEFEMDLRKTLFNVVSRPLMEFVLRVTAQLYRAQAKPSLFADEAGVLAWQSSRRRILEAILKQDEELARFEAERYRQQVLIRLRAGQPV